MLVVVAFLTGGSYLSGLLFLATNAPPWPFRPVKVSTSSELSTLATFGCFTFARLFRHSFTANATVLSRHFLPTSFFYRALLPHIFDMFCDSDAGRNTPSRILLCACLHRVVPSG